MRTALKPRRHYRGSLTAGFSFAAPIAAAALLGIALPARGNLIITPTFDSTITNDTANAANIEAAINATISRVEADISNNITVAIDFQEMSSGLGQSQTSEYYSSYSNYRSLLANNQTLSTNDTIALANLPNQTASPVNGNTTSQAFAIASPLLRALGQSAPAAITLGSQNYDGVIGLNTSICNISRTGAQNSGYYDLQAVAGHEIDEVLGIGGTGSGLYLAGTYTGQTPSSTAGVLDLYRYGASGSRSYTLNPAVNAYFSIDNGVHHFVYFNQNNNGSDFSDWGNGTPNAEAGNSPAQLQDAFGTSGVDTNIGGTELAALDVEGYNLTAAGLSAEASAPEPASCSLVVLSAWGLLARRRRMGV